MKVKNKSRYFLSAVLVLLLIIGVFSLSSRGWMNSHKKYNVYAKTYGAYQTSYYSSGDGQKDYYGTHDWIAESALMVLYEYRSSNAFLASLYFDTGFMKMYFLLGTEAPDIRLNYRHTPIELYDCKGRKYGSANILTTYDHDIHFEGVVPFDFGLASLASQCQALAIQALQEGDCKKAAFFLGAMCHAIGDAASYCHLFYGSDINPEDPTAGARTLTGHKNTFETKIARLTWRVQRLRQDAFFSVAEAINLFPSSFKETGWMAAYRTGLYVDNLKQNLWDIHVQHPEFYPSEVDDLYPWTRTTFETIQGEGNERSTYFANIQLCLNVAVLHCALAIDLALDSYTDCNCQGESQSKEEIQVYQNLIEQQTFAYFLITGTASMFLSLGALLMAKKAKL